MYESEIALTAGIEAVAAPLIQPTSVEPDKSLPTVPTAAARSSVQTTIARPRAASE